MAWRGRELVIWAALACAPAVARAAESGSAPPPANHAVYAEVFGSGIVPSINYAHRIGDANLRAGLGYWSSLDSDDQSRWTYVTIPLTGVVHIGRGPIRLEVGGGMSFVHLTVIGAGTPSGFPLRPIAQPTSSWLPMVTGLIGLRYSPHGAGLTAGLSFTPVLAVLANAEVIGADRGTTLSFLPWGGGSIGYQF